MADFLHDAKRYILKNSSISDNAPLQIYCSGLIFAPRRSIIRELFKAELRNWIDHLPQVEENWTSDLQTLEGHSGSVRLVSFSPDGRLLASRSYDSTVRLWDTATGVLQHTLKHQSKESRSVAFSPDSQRLVSVSADNSACLWDTATGVLQYAFENEDKGYSNNWLKVFSPNGQLLASSSSYRTIKVRGTATGGLQHTLKGHLDKLSSMAFSPDSKILASGSHDRTIRLWDMTTGTSRHTLRGHSDGINSIAFSPNGQQLASGSDDNTVRIWDTAIRVSQQTLSEGHSESVKSVVFSPDGQLLASSSYVPLPESSSNDRTVLLWHTATGKLLHTFESNLSDIYLVAFSPESRFLAVSSSRSIVRIWDTATGVMIGSCIKGKMTELKFSTDLSSPTTDITARGILRWLSNNNQKSSKSMANIGVRGGLGGQWVTLQGNEILWLPSEYRSTCSAVKHRTLALGHASGRVSFLHFNLN
jgi:WD40 repeat protein